MTKFAELGIKVSEDDADVIRRDGQIRLWWDEYPVDLFFDTMEFHTSIRNRAHNVPFLDRLIPIIAEEHLIARKAIFNRPKDWLDIENMLRDAPEDLDTTEAHRWVSIITDTGVCARLDALFTSYGFGA